MRAVLLSIPWFCVATLYAPPSSSIAAMLYGGGVNSQLLYSIDLLTGAKTRVPLADPDPISRNLRGISGLAYNTSDGYLYATLQQPSRNFGQMYQIDINNLNLQYRRVTGPGISSDTHFSGLEYDQVRNVFWATTFSPWQFVRIDALTYEAQIVGVFPPGLRIDGLAMDTANDTLYAVQDQFLTTGNSSLVIVNRDTLELTQIGEPGLGLGLYDIDSLAFNPMDGMLYAINDGSPVVPGPYQQLVRIDPSTGVASPIGFPSTEIEAFQGLAFVIPEPSAIYLIIIGAVLLGIRLVAVRPC